MMLPSQVLVLDLACLCPGWRAAPVQQDMRGSSVSAAPPGTGERHQAWGLTAPVCHALATGTARPASPRLVRGDHETGSSKRAVLSELDSEANPVFLSVAGVCNCRDNTAGAHCEKCSDGYYGDATAGTASDCQPCPCPGSSSCAIVPRTREVVCTSCQTGTTGMFLHKKPKLCVFSTAHMLWKPFSSQSRGSDLQ